MVKKTRLLNHNWKVRSPVKLVKENKERANLISVNVLFFNRTIINANALDRIEHRQTEGWKKV